MLSYLTQFPNMGISSVSNFSLSFCFLFSFSDSSSYGHGEFQVFFRFFFFFTPPPLLSGGSCLPACAYAPKMEGPWAQT